MFFRLKHFLACIMSIVSFILVDLNLVTEEMVFGGKYELNSLDCCFKSKWGSEGASEDLLLRPHDVNFDSKGIVYVSNRDRNDMQKFAQMEPLS